MKNFPVDDVKRILGISLKPTLGGTVSYKNASYQQLKELVDIGAAELDEHQNSAPTIGEFLSDLKSVKDKVRFNGYVVPPPRDNTRVSVEGFTGEGLTEGEALDLLYAYRHADECRVRRETSGVFVDFWWD